MGESGAGAGLYFAFNQNLAIMIRLDATQLEDEDRNKSAMANVDLGMNYYFGNAEKKLRPFVGLSITANSDVFNTIPEQQITANGVALSGGVLYFLLPKVGLNASYTFANMDVEEISVGGEKLEGFDPYSITSGRLLLGLRFSL